MPLLVTAMLLFDTDGRALMAQRQSPPSLAGMWEFPGGKMDPGESPEECLEREILEELDLSVRVVRIADVVYHRYPDTGDVLILCYECRLVAGEPRAMEGQAYRWAHPSEMALLNIAPADLPIAARLRGLGNGAGGSGVPVR